jgi:hypothetical protein
VSAARLLGLLVLFAACDRQAQPPEPGQRFCCASLDLATFSGEGCSTLRASEADTCDKQLHCAGTWKRDGAQVICESGR